jgi:Lrp/AsnC family leucine-responsive transcriptional regulator
MRLQIRALQAFRTGSFFCSLAAVATNRRDFLDSTDRLLLVELQNDARLSLAELGRRVGLSPPAVAERVARLTEEGVIRGFHADVDPRAVGYALSAIVRVRPAPRQLKAVADLARETPEVVECHRITGEDCYFVKAHVTSVEHLEEVIDRFTAYGQTTTSVMQTSPVPLRAISLPTEEPRP